MMYPGGLMVKASDAYLHLLQIFTRVTYIWKKELTCMLELNENNIKYSEGGMLFKLPKIPWWPPVQYLTMCNREDVCKSSSNLG